LDPGRFIALRRVVRAIARMSVLMTVRTRMFVAKRLFRGRLNGGTASCPAPLQVGMMMKQPRHARAGEIAGDREPSRYFVNKRAPHGSHPIECVVQSSCINDKSIAAQSARQAQFLKNI
jgi:hypothetical protein